MHRGFMYLIAIMDWATRKVLSWRLSNSLDTRFCVEALKVAQFKYGAPEIFNTDQGCLFTSEVSPPSSKLGMSESAWTARGASKITFSSNDSGGH